MTSFIKKYNITELDVYKLALIESKKVGSSYMQKERLKAATLTVLKPYKVSFLDLAKITNEIKSGGFENNQELQRKYADINLEEQITNDSNIEKYYSGVIDTFKSYSKGKKAAIIIGILLVLSFFMQNKNSSGSSSNSSSTNNNSQSCLGNEGCISKVRENFTNTGKTILGEEYIGNGKFGISFMDSQNPGAYNATVTTDCNCNVTNVNVSTIH